jgi:hypothetical protein
MAENTKTKSKVASLLPNADTYIKHNMNVMLIGLHGTGKTETVRQIAADMGYKVKSYSCSTLDPFTDLVGVPIPKEENGRTVLKMIRPIDIDEAEIVFFDELNRARPEVQDAVLEIINNKTINGEPLPKLKCCWAAINPPNGDYNVDELDPALMDRFDAYIEFTPRPSVAYMSQTMPKEVAQALKSWWDDHNREKREAYVSPRRLHKIGLVFMAHKTKRAVLQALPPGGKFDSTKLYMMLDEALHPEKAANRGGIGDAAAAGFDFSSPKALQPKATELATFLQANPNALETHRKVQNTLSNGVSGEVLVREWDEVLDSLHEPVLEALVTSYPQPKQSQMRLAYQERMDGNGGTQWARSRRTLYNVLNNTSKNAYSQMPPIP